MAAFALEGMGRGKVSSHAFIHDTCTYGKGRLCTAESRSGSTVTTAIAHDPSGAVTGWTYGNGIVHARSRDTDGRLTGISSVHGGTVYQSLTYGWNEGDQITAVTNAVDAAQSHHYDYDPLGRLTQDRVGGSVVIVDGFDAVGNRTSRTRSDSGVQTALIHYPIEPGSNRMLAMSGSTQRNFVYNPNGHLMSSSGWLGNRSYVYDAFERLRSVTVGTAATTYLVNALDQRVGKTGPQGARRYVYAGQNTLLGERDRKSVV